jgi:hypothetical protein
MIVNSDASEGLVNRTDRKFYQFDVKKVHVTIARSRCAVQASFYLQHG